MRISDWSSDVCSSDLPIVIVTAYTDIQTIDLAKQIPPADRLFVLQKPFHTTEIQQLAIALTARWALEQAGTQEVSSVDLEALRPLAEMGSEEPTSELQSLMRISYAVFCSKKQKNSNNNN